MMSLTEQSKSIATFLIALISFSSNLVVNCTLAILPYRLIHKKNQYAFFDIKDFY